MKNNFEDILNQQNTTNEGTEGAIKKDVPVSPSSNSSVESDPLQKFKNHRNKKKNKIKIVVPEPVTETLPETTPVKEVVVEEVPVAETKPPVENSFGINLDLSPIEETVEELPVETEVSPVVQEPSVEEVPVEQPEPATFVEEPSEPIQEDITPIETVDPVVTQEVVEETIEEVQKPVVKVPKKYQLKKEVTKIKPIETEPTDSVEKEVSSKPSETKRVVGNLSSLKKNFWNKVTFNKDYNRLVPFFVGASLLIVVLLVAVSLNTNQDISGEVSVEAKSAITPQNDQNAVNKDTKTLLMEKSINEGLAVNHYSLFNQYASLLKETNYPKDGYYLIENLMLQASPDSVNVYTVNGREYPATAVVSAWAIETNGSKSVLEKNSDAIKIAIETAFFNKDKTFFNDDKASLEIIAFAIERVTGQKFKVEKVLLKGDFK